MTLTPEQRETLKIKRAAYVREYNRDYARRRRNGIDEQNVSISPLDIEMAKRYADLPPMSNYVLIDLSDRHPKLPKPQKRKPKW